MMTQYDDGFVWFGLFGFVQVLVFVWFASRVQVFHNTVWVGGRTVT